MRYWWIVGILAGMSCLAGGCATTVTRAELRQRVGTANVFDDLYYMGTRGDYHYIVQEQWFFASRHHYRISNDELPLGERLLVEPQEVHNAPEGWVLLTPRRPSSARPLIWLEDQPDPLRPAKRP